MLQVQRASCPLVSVCQAEGCEVVRMRFGTTSDTLTRSFAVRFLKRVGLDRSRLAVKVAGGRLRVSAWTGLPGMQGRFRGFDAKYQFGR